MDRIGVDRLREVSPDRSGRSFLGVCGAHQFAVQGNGVLTLKHLNNNRPGSHKPDQIGVKRALFVLGIKPAGQIIGEMYQFGRHNRQSRGFESTDNLSDHILANCVRLNNR